MFPFFKRTETMVYQPSNNDYPISPNDDPIDCEKIYITCLKQVLEFTYRKYNVAFDEQLNACKHSFNICSKQ